MTNAKKGTRLLSLNVVVLRTENLAAWFPTIVMDGILFLDFAARTHVVH